MSGLAAAESYNAIRDDYQELIKSSQLQRQRMNWERLIRRFERFALQSPRHPDVERALYLKAKTWAGLAHASGNKTDARRAIDAFLEMAERFPQSRLADDALYHAGQVSEHRLADLTAAANYYSRLLRQMPQADMADDARKRLTVLPQPAVVPSLSSLPSGTPAVLKNIRYWSGPEYTRVVLDLSSPVTTEPHLLKSGQPRLYFDLPNTEPGTSLEPDIPILNGVVQRVRASRFDEKQTRVVLDLYQVRDYKMVTLGHPDRVVIDITGNGRGAPGKGEAVLSSPGNKADDSIANILNGAADATSGALHVPQQNKNDGIRLIVVDAGHGGKDPGAIGANGVQEKNITLQMAKKLAQKLRRDLGVKVLMTRSTDKFLELRERTAYANQVGADLFISLHVNASRNRRAYGLETYFLNLSKNNQAAEVAARENGTSLQDVSNLEAILFDLMANAKINESSRLAAEVQQSMVSNLRPHYSKIKDLGVRQGPFHVLLGATMPSVLVETAFISNNREVKRLVTDSYQDHVAAAIVKGVKQYSATIDRVARR